MGADINGNGQAESLSPNEQLSILLVEDDNVTLRQVELMLKKYGNYQVTTACNGRIALQLLKEAKTSGRKGFDLVLTDLILPEISGFDLIHEVVAGKGKVIDVPIVVMSSQDSRESVLQAFEAGAADYLIKPIRKNEVSTLWQHIWRNNRLKGVHAGSAAPHPPGNTSVLGNDSGASSTEAAQSNLFSSGQYPNALSHIPQSTNGSLQTGAPGGNSNLMAVDSAPEQQLQQHRAQPTSQSCMVPGTSGPSHNPEKTLRATAVAAVHLDITNAAELLQVKAREAAAGVSQRTNDADAVCASQPCSAQPGSSGTPPSDETLQHKSLQQSPPTSLTPVSSEPEKPFGSTLNCAPAVCSKGPPTRPQAMSTAGSNTGQHVELPPGLEELAALGQRRQQEQQQQQQPGEQPQQVAEHVQGDQGGLGRSGRSAFTAVTVFLPRPLSPGQDSLPVSVPAVLLPALPSPQAQPPSNGPATATWPQSMPDPSHPAHTSSSPFQQYKDPGMPISPPAPAPGQQPGAPPRWQPPPLSGPVLLPDSVIQLICALSTGRPAAEARPSNGASRLHSAHSLSLSGPGSEAGLHISKSIAAAHRHAAVAKYLLKRKNRTFHKKVRYESRKRLAESRPRVRGQFVKQVGGVALVSGDQTQPSTADATEQSREGVKSEENGSRDTEQDAAEALGAMAVGMARPSGSGASSKRARAVVVREEEEYEEEGYMSEDEP